MNKDAMESCVDLQVVELKKVAEAKDLLAAWEKTLEYVREKIATALPHLEK